MYLNPFYNIIENSRFPHARTWRTSFLQKLVDVFYIFAGRGIFDIRENSYHYGPYKENSGLGLVDYFTLGLTYFVPLLFKRATNVELLFAKILISSLLFVPFLITYFTPIFTGLALTIAVSPLILLTHCVARLVSWQDHSRVQKECYHYSWQGLMGYYEDLPSDLQKTDFDAWTLEKKLTLLSYYRLNVGDCLNLRHNFQELCDSLQTNLKPN